MNNLANSPEVPKRKTQDADGDVKYLVKVTRRKALDSADDSKSMAAQYQARQFFLF